MCHDRSDAGRSERITGNCEGTASARFNRKPQYVAGTKRRKRSPSFLSAWSNVLRVVAMGVIDRAKAMSGLTDPEDAGCSYICLACETAFEVQHHNCPACGSFDVRCSRWIQE